MSPSTIGRPQANEHADFYLQYVSKVPDGDLLSLLREQSADTVRLLQDLTPDQANYAYAPGKWTIKEVVGHIGDAERIFAYRALRIARNDPTPLSSFDENTYVANANFGARALSDLLDELQVVRASTIHLAKSWDAETLARVGTASGKPVSVRALLYIIAGHERHHAALFRERYLSR
ncbi:MAG: DinB family protein [Gemmatimonadaceae bacterium]